MASLAHAAILSCSSDLGLGLSTRCDCGRDLFLKVLNDYDYWITFGLLLVQFGN